MDFNFIHYLIDGVVSLGVIAVGFPYLKGNIRKGREQTQEESNQLLRNLVDDQKKSIDRLEEWRKEAEKKMAYLEGRVEELNTKKGDLETIIGQALSNFFESHPEIAVDIHTKLNGQNV